MKKLWLLLPLALATTPVLAQSCALTGTIKGIGAKPIIFRYVQQGKLHRDTVRAVNDRFAYTAKPSDDGKIALIVSNPFRYFWNEPGKLTVTGDMAQPSQLTVVGTPENNLLNQLQHDIEWKFAQARKAQPTATDQLNEQEQQATRQFIKSYPGSRTAADALYQQTFVNEKPLAEYDQLLKGLTPAVRQSVQGQQATKRLLVLQHQPGVGRPVPAFSIADTAGTPHALATYQNQYVLLDFWGHWCGPCLHAQYSNKLAIIGIAMEDASDAALWKQAIRKYEVPGLQLSELQQAAGPVISGYNVTAFPTYMLLDRRGVLVLRTNDIAEVEQKLLTIADL